MCKKSEGLNINIVECKLKFLEGDKMPMGCLNINIVECKCEPGIQILKHRKQS